MAWMPAYIVVGNLLIMISMVVKPYTSIVHCAIIDVDFLFLSLQGIVPFFLVILKGTNLGQKWYQSTAYDLPLFRWRFFFNLKGLRSLKIKNVNSALRCTLLVE
jgi:hypothetical protein